MNRIYLDNSSTSFPKPREVLDEMASYFLNNGSNLSRGESVYTFMLEDELISLRELISELVNNKRSENVCFTPNVTYALNTVINGLLNSGDEVLITPIEHNAVMRPLVHKKISYSFLPCDESGKVDVDKIKNVISTKTRAIIVQVANNVNGTLQDIEGICNNLREYEIPIILDTAQALFHIDLDFSHLNIGALCFTGHKAMLGPQGTGGFILTPSIKDRIEPLIYGGTGTLSDSLTLPSFLPDRFESGTPNTIGLLGLKRALEYVKRNKSEIRDKEREIRDYFIDKINDIKAFKLFSESHEIPLVSLYSREYDVATLANYLSKNNIQTRVGLHCNVMTHKYINTYPEGTIRFSFSHYNTKDEIDFTIDKIRSFVYEKGSL